MPIRLAYIGACHYDSIKPQNSEGTGLIDNQCGDF
jgi:hypothetical protein